MTYARLDPRYPKGVVLATKLGVTDAQRVAELARQAGVGKSEFLRALVLRELGRCDTEPPSQAA